MKEVLLWLVADHSLTLSGYQWAVLIPIVCALYVLAGCLFINAINRSIQLWR